MSDRAFNSFVLVSTQRSGSTWVTDLLNSHSQICSYTELFLKKGSGHPDWGEYKDAYYWNTFREKSTRSFRALALGDYLEDIFSRNPGAKAKGFKLMYNQLLWTPELVFYLIKYKTRIIHLQRRNTLDIVLSDLAKGQRGVAHVSSGEPVKTEKLQVDVPSLLVNLRKFDRRKRAYRLLLSHIGLDYLDLYYEDVASGKNSSEQLLPFLGVDSEQLSSGMTKLSPSKHSESIENIEEVTGALSGGKFFNLLRL